MKRPVQKLRNESLCSMGKNLSHSPFLQALAEREENIRNGKLTVFGLILNENGLMTFLVAYLHSGF
jgi:hypothetical protein